MTRQNPLPASMRRREILKAAVVALGTGVSASLSRALLSDTLLVTEDAAAAFSDSQRASVAILSDMIIPPTETPGAVEAGVPDFIATIFSDWYTDAERERFLQGLAALDAFSFERENNPFQSASKATQMAALTEQAGMASNQTPPLPGPFGGGSIGEDAPFFARLRELVVLGYYTSEIGATHELAYLPVPGRFDGDYAFDQVGRQYTH